MHRDRRAVVGVIDFDHVAIATHDVGPALSVLVGELGAEVLFGGEQFGFRAMQCRCGDMRIELLEPHQTEFNDFLARFLARNGEGPHHMTFKTDDISRELERFGDAGYRPVGVNIDNPWWKEAFIHPSQAGGTVVQIAESSFGPEQMEARREEIAEYTGGPWWPEPGTRARQTAELRRVVVVTGEIDRALSLYADLLGGRIDVRGEGWVELAWPGGRVRLEPSAGRAPGIDRLEWTHASTIERRVVAGTSLVLYPVAP